MQTTGGKSTAHMRIERQTSFTTEHLQSCSKRREYYEYSATLPTVFPEDQAILGEWLLVPPRKDDGN